MSTVRLVDALVVLVAAAGCAFCAGVAEVRRARELEAVTSDPAAKAGVPS
ncbi:hypothetical protein [Leifsonia shinshuensis]|nr:hypothetical protein [Leifsonia shinshuensis]